MNINEAIKLATPGPLGIYAKDDIFLTENADGSCRMAPFAREDEATARLLAHWYNHGPELLEAIKEAIDIVGEEGDHNCQETCDVYFLLKPLLDKASNVEGLGGD